MEAVIWYREDSIGYEAAKYHVSIEDLAWVYKLRGRDLTGEIQVGNALKRQRERLLSFLQHQGFSVREIPMSMMNLLAEDQTAEDEVRRIVNRADLFVSLGGDSTLLHGSWLIDHQSDVTVIGVNSNPRRRRKREEDDLPSNRSSGATGTRGATGGSFGGLLWPSLETLIEEWPANLTGDHGAGALEEWTRIAVELDGTPVGYALGDVYIGAAQPTIASHYTLTINRLRGRDEACRHVEEQGSSGILVYTGAGAGHGSWRRNIPGYGYDDDLWQDTPEFRYVVREPFGGIGDPGPLGGSFRTMPQYQHLSGSFRSGDSLEVTSRMVRGGGMVQVDSNQATGNSPFPSKAKVRFTLAPCSLKVIAPRGCPLQ